MGPLGMKLDKASSLQLLTILDPTGSNKQILINKKGCDTASVSQSQMEILEV
jgi:hypothetical protein